MQQVSIALHADGGGLFRRNYEELRRAAPEADFFLCGPTTEESAPDRTIVGPGLLHGACLRPLIRNCRTDWLVLVLRREALRLKALAIERLVQECADATAAYAAHYRRKERADFCELQPLIEYQEGAVRDDFDFGNLVIVNTQAARRVLSEHAELLPDNAAGWYGLRLGLTLQGFPRLVPDPLYSVILDCEVDSEREHFSYVDPANREYQRQAESTFAAYARRAGFYLEPVLAGEDLSAGDFACEASVIIPVKNRRATIAEAVESACSQSTSFDFNVIVVDNHSDDGTTGILQELAGKDNRVKHRVPRAPDLGIGGCWNESLHDSECGRFAVQLDSDDLYADERVLQRIVDAFYATRAAAVVGSYTLVDRTLHVIPPGLIDHREWSDENGHNNALRINGFGAPRAYCTAVAREIGFPNVSYGEDYAMMLAIARRRKIARIYDSLYWCRRWEGNSDARPTVARLNEFNRYKDSVRTAEIRKRKELSASLTARGNTAGS